MWSGVSRISVLENLAFFFKNKKNSEFTIRAVYIRSSGVYNCDATEPVLYSALLDKKGNEPDRIGTLGHAH